ncbi:hypothetical protein [Stakelama tenebrarum]|uniref:TonB C-terminal domain-containing protein n=1 Tax=Stakelama tenebrarum TaxID=2711215 RepID=A0A6G6Y3T0_9SPHN|nr:hypothetical protein [Sphingosinithalassobacter tenebrarum]QIG79560.1 hypothetical protein G5C33_06985 [Sphingosinithalassobacter tenebrarum]
MSRLAALLLMTGGFTAPAPPPQQTATIDWSSLPDLPYRAPPRLSRDMHDFAFREARSRSCPIADPNSGQWRMQVDIAVLVDGSGVVRVAVPRAIDCPTVEQYAAGLATAFAQNNLLPRESRTPQWYRTSLSFAWPQ